MIRNVIYYLVLLFAVFLFSVFYFEWFSWVLFVIAVAMPFVSLLISLPFMILCAHRGVFLFTNDRISRREVFNIGVASGKKSLPFVPAMKLRLMAENRFSGESFRLNLGIAGSMSKPRVFTDNRLSEHCGTVEINVRSCRVYDFMGLFFLPVRTAKKLECDILPKPEKPEMLPDFSDIAVVGYKMKSGGGFSDYYELRPFRDGDTLKAVHWKVSSKYDDLIVREPSVPVFKRFAVRLKLSEKSEDNDSIIARYLYTAKRVLATELPCCSCCENRAGICEVSTEEEAVDFIKSVYRGTTYRNEILPDPEMLFFTVSSRGEEVERQ